MSYDQSCKNDDEKLLKLIQFKVKYFRDKNNVKYALVEQTKNTRRLVLIPSEDFTIWLRKMYYSNFKKIISTECINNVQNLCIMFANEDDIEERKIYRRIGQDGSTLYYDLSDAQKNLVIVNKEKVEIVTNANLMVCFENSIPQIYPNLQTDSSELLNLIGNLFRVNDDELLLLSVYIISCFILNISHPILAIFGREGSAKTSSLKALQKIIDPAKGVYRFPSKDSDLIATLANNYFLAFDNLRNISPEMSDTVCQISTGGVVGQRQLYHNTKLLDIDIKRCLCLNGINIVATEKDLLDRTILIELNYIPEEERITDKDYQSLIEALLPNILGGIFNSLHKALNMYDNVKLPMKYRMADFTEYGYCIAESIKEGYGNKFLKAYGENIKNTKLEAKDPIVVACIMTFMSDRSTWTGSLSQLHSLLQPTIRKNGYRIVDFPANSSALSRKINECINILSANNIEISQQTGGSRLLTIVNDSYAETVDII